MSEGWPTPIPVTERLPEPGQLVLAWDPRERSDGDGTKEWEPARFQHQESEAWQAQDCCRSEIEPTHWLPLPPPVQGDTWSKPEPSPISDFAAAREGNTGLGRASRRNAGSARAPG